MHILVYKWKDSSLGKLVAFLLVFALIVPLVTHYYLGKQTLPFESTQISFQSRTKLDRSVDQVDSLLDRIDELQDQVKELQRIKLSLSNELRELEGKKSKLQGEIRVFSKKSESLKNEAEKFRVDVSLAQRELEQIKLAKIRAKDCPELPHLKLPERLTASSLSGYEALVTQRLTVHCRLDNCFDFSRCPYNSGFPVFVYDQTIGNHFAYTSILELLKKSSFYTSEAEKACLYIVLLGSVVRGEHRRSRNDVETKLHSLPYWAGNGKNHLLLQITTLNELSQSVLSEGINTGFALIAQTTFSGESIYRHGFDTVIPPLNGPLTGDVWHLSSLQLPAKRQYLLSFQAGHRKDLAGSMASLKRQLLNLSVEAKDFYIHISLSLDQIEIGDEWVLCGDQENRKKILNKSTFALILGSNTVASSWNSNHIRLLEALQYGTIPVVLSSEVKLPFEDMIDWRKAAIVLAPARVTELNVLLRTVTNNDILAMRRQGRFLWETYLSTTEAVLNTVLASVRTRLAIPAEHVVGSPTPSVFSELNPPATNSPDPEALIALPQLSPTFIRNLTVTIVDTYDVWNSPPGAFRMYESSPFSPVLPSSAPFRNSSKGFELIGNGMGGAGEEFSKALGGNHPVEQFTIVILTYQRDVVLMESIQRLVGLQYLNKVLVVWNSPDPPSLSLRWPNIGVPIHVVKVAKNSLNNRFIPFDAIETDAIFSIDDDVEMRHEEILLAFRVWRESRDRIVGFPARFHAWDAANQQWLYSSEYCCELSMILTGAAFYHKYYAYLYTHWMSQAIRDQVDEFMNCEDIAMNFLVSHITRKPPIKVTSRWTFVCPGCPVSLWNDKTHFEERSKCINSLVKVYGYMPLLRTQFRADSILFKTRIPADKTKCFKYV